MMAESEGNDDADAISLEKCTPHNESMERVNGKAEGEGEKRRGRFFNASSFPEME
jgi:hypothetical protein